MVAAGAAHPRRRIAAVHILLADRWPMSFPYRQITDPLAAPQAQFEVFSSSGPRRRTTTEQTAYGPYGLGGVTYAKESETCSQPLSIAHIGPCLCRGGAEQQVIDLSRFLNPRRSQLVKCLVLPEGRVDPNVARDFPCPIEVGTRDAIHRAVQEHDICLFWGFALDQHLAGLKKRHAVNVFLAHGDSWWTRDLLRDGRRSIDHVIAVSEGVRKANCGGFPTTVIHNGVDTARLATTRSRDEVRSQLGFGHHDFVTGFVGRFAPEKRPDRLIRAVATLPPQHKALIVGWGPDKPRLLELAAELLPNRHAFVTASEYLGDYYQAMDAFSLVSDNEGFALVLLEAMFCGLPIVATPVGAVPEVTINGINGVSVQGNVSEIAMALERMRQHPHWARGMGREGREYAVQFGHARRMACLYETVFEKLLSLHRGRTFPAYARSCEDAQTRQEPRLRPDPNCQSL